MTELSEGKKTPRIYAYTEPQYKNTEWQGKRRGKGLIKVGYTEKTAYKRISEQFGTNKPTDTPFEILLDEIAIREDGTFFKDFDVHEILEENGVQRIVIQDTCDKTKRTEWFECSIEDVIKAINSVKTRTKKMSSCYKNFKMRPEQQKAVEITRDYFKKYAKEKHDGIAPHFLWNAKMRFGKTFTAYQLAKAMNWTKVLVLTFKPAVKNSWEQDLLSHVDFKDWQFISKNEVEAGDIDESKPNIIRFASFQDVLQKTDAGGIKLHNTDIHLTEWDCIILDEYHFGAWNQNSKDLYDKDDNEKYKERKELSSETGEKEVDYYDEQLVSKTLTTNAYLYLSGTPFRALSEGEFTEDQIFNWTYSDEQKAKAEWKEENGKNPYLELPQMKLMTYKLPADIEQIALKGQFNEFDLNEFFNAQEIGGKYKFKHEPEVKQWLDLIRGQYLKCAENDLKSQKPIMPYSYLKNQLDHTFWFLPSVASCRAMKDLLENHTSYKEYEVTACAGTEAGIGEEALKRVHEKIKNGFSTKTITLSCGKLTTGVTVPEWSGIFMLRNTSSPETYFQAAFRVQSPWTLKNPDGVNPNETLVIKDTCFIFDFAPTRALKNIRDYCENLIINSKENTEEKIKELLNFLPVLCYDGGYTERIDLESILNYIITGTTSTMLAKKWECATLVSVENDVLKKLFANEQALNALASIESFKKSNNFDLKKDLEIIISRADAIKKVKEEQKGKLSSSEKKELTAEEKEYRSKRKEIQDKLKKLATRIPIFMYLTDNREVCLQMVIEAIEPDLFKKVTGLTIPDFELLKEIGVFNESNMNRGVVAFKRYEDDSLSYTGISRQPDNGKVGGWNATFNKDDTI